MKSVNLYYAAHESDFGNFNDYMHKNILKAIKDAKMLAEDNDSDCYIFEVTFKPIKKVSIPKRDITIEDIK